MVTFLRTGWPPFNLSPRAGRGEPDSRAVSKQNHHALEHDSMAHAPTEPAMRRLILPPRDGLSSFDQSDVLTRGAGPGTRPSLGRQCLRRMRVAGIAVLHQNRD